MKALYWMILILIAAGSIAAQVWAVPQEAPAWERLPGFWSVLGLIGSGGFILLAVILRKWILGRDEDYYR